MLGEDDTNPSKGAELHEFSCNLFEFRPRELFCNRTVKPLALAVASEQVPLDASTGSQIVCFADKLRYSAGRLDRAVCDITPDCVGLVALPAAIEIVPGGKLYIDIGGAAICLSDVEGDLAFGKGIENRFCEISQTKAPLYVTNGDSQTARYVLLGFALVQGGAVTTTFIGGRHGFTDEVFGQTDFFSERRFFVIAHTGINHGVLWQLATFDELCDSAPASAASVDIEDRFLVGSRADDDGLQKAICVDRDR